MQQMAIEERADFADFLATLAPEQWEAPTLCADWRVRDVVAHVISYDALGVRDVIARFVKGRLQLNRINALGVAEFHTRSPDALVAYLRQHLEPRGIPAAFGGMIALVDALIHQQDIRRPLGMPREIPPERLDRALRSALLAPPIGAFLRARGLRLVATDLDWSAGRGLEVRGPGESILMALAGRRDVVHELAGPGRSKLAGRIDD